MRLVPILVAMSALIQSGCPAEDGNTGKLNPVNCKSASGVYVTVLYGDSALMVEPSVQHVVRTKTFEVRLHAIQRGPRTRQYEDQDVTVRVDLNRGNDQQWISNGNVAAGTSPIIICVPSDTTIGEYYNYTVKVVDIGEVNARVKVTQ